MAKEGTQTPPDIAGPATNGSAKPGLRAHALGFPAVLAQSIGVISPTMTAVLIVALAYSDSGNGTWLAYAFGTIMLMFVVFGLNQFARRSASAGSMYAYTGKGLGASSGVLSGWTLLWSYMFIGVAGLAGFAIFAQAFINAVGLHVTVPPVLLFLIGASLCWHVAYKDIRVSSLLTLCLEAISITFIVMLAGVILFKHGFSLDTAQVRLSGVNLHGISLAVVVSIFSLVGFESATTLGGEARNPLKNVPKAVIWSLAFAGLFFVFMSYVEVSGARLSHTPLDDMTAPLNTLAALYGVPALKIPISLGASISFFGLSLTCLNAGARIMFPMAQHVVFPSLFGHVHHRNRTPHKAITTYIALIVAIPIVLEIFTNPNTIFDEAGVLAAFGFLLAYFLISAAAPMYLRKLGELRPRYVVIAVLAFLCLLVPTIGSFYPVPAYPVNLFPYIFAGYMLVGTGWLLFQRKRNPTILSEIAADLARSSSVKADGTEPAEIETPAPISVESQSVPLTSAAEAGEGDGWTPGPARDATARRAGAAAPRGDQPCREGTMYPPAGPGTYRPGIQSGPRIRRIPVVLPDQAGLGPVAGASADSAVISARRFPVHGPAPVAQDGLLLPARRRPPGLQRVISQVATPAGGASSVAPASPGVLTTPGSDTGPASTCAT